MKSINLDLKQLISTALACGALTKADIQEAANEQRGLTYPCGFASDTHGQFYSIFFATDKDDRSEVLRSKDKVRIKFNIRADKRPKVQAAQTPGSVLPAGQSGVPNLTPDALAALSTVVNLLSAQQAQPKSTPDDSDFSDLNVSGDVGGDDIPF